MKTTLAIVVGYAVWTVCWLGGNAGLRALGLTPKDQTARIESFSPLAALLILSVAASVFSGYLTGRISSTKVAPYGCISLLLATGCAVQWMSRSLFPLWYHLTFLLLLAPVFLLGIRFARKG